jgi:archaemetzincin
MRAIHLLAAGDGVPLEVLDELAADLARVFRISCHVRPEALDAEFAHDSARNQYYSTLILQRLIPIAPGDGTRLLAIAAVDLFVPVLTFVFGEAQLAGPCALVSLCRLREEFYGLPPRPEVLRERVLKEALHELGHTFGLRHCGDWTCAMASTHAIERLDIKRAELCARCRRAVPPA